MDKDYDDLNDVYASTTKGIEVPLMDTNFITEAQVTGGGRDTYDTYFGTNRNNVQTQPQQNSQLLTEKQQRNQLLYEAASKVKNLIPLFEARQDKEYVNEIKQALEELMEQ